MYHGLDAVGIDKQVIREGFKKKSKNMMEFSIIGLTPPHPYDGKFLSQESVRRTPPR